MNALYGTVIQSELEIETRKLQKPLGSLNDFDKLVHTHVSLHALSAENGAPISEFDKIKFLKTALLQHEEFKIPIQLFEHDKTLNDPDRTFATFRQNMVRAHSELDFHPSKPNSTRGFASNAIEKKRSRDDEDEDASTEPANEEIPERSSRRQRKSTSAQSPNFSAADLAKEFLCQISAGKVVPQKQPAKYCCTDSETIPQRNAQPQKMAT